MTQKLEVFWVLGGVQHTLRAVAVSGLLENDISKYAGFYSKVEGFGLRVQHCGFRFGRFSRQGRVCQTVARTISQLVFYRAHVLSRSHTTNDTDA